MSNNQRESLEDRLAKRRRVRNKRFIHKNSVDESEIRLINHSPTTQSLDRKSSKRVTPISSLTSPATLTRFNEQRQSSSAITRNPELPPIENSHLKQNYLLSDNKTNSTPLLPQVTKHQSLESENDKQASSKSLSTNEQQQNYSHQDEKPVIIKETVSSPVTVEKFNATHKNYHSHEDEKPVIIKKTVLPPTTTEKSNAIQEEMHEKTYAQQDEKPVIIKETATSTLPPIIPSTITEKSDPIQQETHEKPVIIKENVTPVLPSTTTEKPIPIPRRTRENFLPNRIKSFPQSSELDHPSSDPQSTTDCQQKTFSYPPFHPKPIARTTSEQIVSITKRKNQLIDPIFAKQNSLALSYLFNERMIHSQLDHATSLDHEESKRKTVWD